jgi:hypothetical protein
LRDDVLARNRIQAATVRQELSPMSVLLARLPIGTTDE